MDKTRIEKPDKRFIVVALFLSLAVALIYAYDFFFMIFDERTVFSDCKTQIGYVREWIDNGHLRDMCQAYPLYYIVIRFFYSVTHSWGGVVMGFICIWSFVTNMTQILVMRGLCGTGSGAFSIFAGSALSFAYPISSKYSFFPGGNEPISDMLLEQVFLTSGATSNTHSPTYLFAKPFAILALYLFIRMMDAETDGKAAKFGALFAVCFFLSTIAKPCFYQCFAPAGFIATVCFFVAHRFKELKRCLIVGCSFVPATLWVLYSMSMKLTPYEFSFLEGINFYGDGTPVKYVILRAIVFCVYVLLCLIVLRRFDFVAALGILTYIFGAGEFLCLMETENRDALSMLWGYYMALFILFVTMAVALYRNTHFEAEGNRIRYIAGRMMYIGGNVLLGIHAAFGLAVFILTWLPWWKEYLLRN